MAAIRAIFSRPASVVSAGSKSASQHGFGHRLDLGGDRLHRDRRARSRAAPCDASGGVAEMLHAGEDDEDEEQGQSPCELRRGQRERILVRRCKRIKCG
jgi:hypothetical protein